MVGGDVLAREVVMTLWQWVREHAWLYLLALLLAVALLMPVAVQWLAASECPPCEQRSVTR